MKMMEENKVTTNVEPQAPEPGKAEEPKAEGPKAAPVKQKNPQKVAAGRAGAASRKAKQERLEEKLRKATELQVGAADTPPEAPSTPPTSPSAGTSLYGGSKMAWAIGLAAVLGLAYFAAQTPVKPPTPPPAAPAPEIPKPVKQLKVTHDPFHME